MDSVKSLPNSTIFPVIRLLNCLYYQQKFYYIRVYVIMIFEFQQYEAAMSPYVQPKPVSPEPRPASASTSLPSSQASSVCEPVLTLCSH